MSSDPEKGEQWSSHPCASAALGSIACVTETMHFCLFRFSMEVSNMIFDLGDIQSLEVL